MNKDRENYTIVYYWTRKRLGLKLIEYCILDYIIFLNDYNYKEFNQLKTAKKFHISKNTLKRYLKILVQKQYIKPIEKKGELFKVDDEICEYMRLERKQFIVIFHDKRKELKINDLQFGFLSMVYSLSKNRSNKTANMGIDNYRKYLFIDTVVNFYATVKKLKRKKLIIKKGISFYKLSDEVFDWFYSQDRKFKNNFES